MFRQTAPGRIESMYNKGLPCFGYQDSHCGDPADYMLGTQLQEPNMMQEHLLQQLREHSSTYGQPASKIYENTDRTDYLGAQKLPGALPDPVSVTTDRLSPAAKQSITFHQTSPLSQPADNLEALFEKAEATVDQYLDSPHAAMLFGDDETDTLAQLCARLPSTTRRRNPFNTLVQFAVQNPKQPSTPHSGRKRMQHPSAEAHPSDGFNSYFPNPSAGDAATNSTVPARFSSDSGTPSRRWGLDLSDEGSGVDINWRQSSGENFPLKSPSAAGFPAKQPRFSECCLPHDLRPGNYLIVPPAPANTPVAAAAPTAAPTAVPTAAPANTSTIGRKIKIRIKGSGGLSNKGSSNARSSCPGGWMPTPSKLGCPPASAATAAAQMVLDLSTPPPELPQSQQRFGSCGGAGPFGRSSNGGGGSSSGRRLSGQKHAQEASNEAARMVSPRISQSTPRRSAAGMLDEMSPLAAPTAAGTLGAVMMSPAVPAADVTAPKRRLKLHVQGLGGNRGSSAMKDHSQAGTAAVLADQQYEQPPAAANQYPSFTTWAQAQTEYTPAENLAADGLAAAPNQPATTTSSASAGVRLSPFAAAAAAVAPEKPDNIVWQQQQQQEEEDCQSFIPTCAAHVGISITTQSGTGPSTRRVSSQALMYPSAAPNAGQQRADIFGAVMIPDFGLNAEQQPQQEQQQSVLHLQLPRIRTKSQPLGQAAFSDEFGVAVGTSSNNSSGAGLISRSCANTPSSAETATPAALLGGKPVAAGLPNHISCVTSHAGRNSNSNSPASCFSTGSAAGVGTPVGLTATADARFDLGGYSIRQPLKQSQQRRSTTAEDDEASLIYAQYCRSRQVTTSLQVTKAAVAEDSEAPLVMA